VSRMTTPTEVCRCGFARTPSNAELHADCNDRTFPALPATPESPPRYSTRERIADHRIGDRTGEFLDAVRHANGLLVLRHFTPGPHPADVVVLEADEAAALAAFVLRTMHPGS